MTACSPAPLVLPPADARAAFERASVDAWAIREPFQAAAEAATGARTLANGEGIVSNHQFYLGARDFTEANPAVVGAIIAALADIDVWAKAKPSAAAAELAPSVGIPAPILQVALERQSYGIKALDAKVVAEQQAIADTFHALGLLPKPIVVSDAVRKAGS